MHELKQISRTDVDRIRVQRLMVIRNYKLGLNSEAEKANHGTCRTMRHPPRTQSAYAEFRLAPIASVCLRDVAN
jgi:hypothetical protein